MENYKLVIFLIIINILNNIFDDFRWIFHFNFIHIEIFDSKFIEMKIQRTIFDG